MLHAARTHCIRTYSEREREMNRRAARLTTRGLTARPARLAGCTSRAAAAAHEREREKETYVCRACVHAALE